MGRAPIHRISLPTPFPVGAIHTYLILGEQPTLVDTGVASDASWDALVEGLREHGLAITDLERVVLTHGHVDHYGQAARIRGESGACVIAHAHTAPLVASYPWSTPPVVAANVDFFRRNGAPDDVALRIGQFLAEAEYLQQGTIVDRTLEHGAQLELTPEQDLDVYEVAGHYPGHIVLYDRETRTLIGGDHLLDDGTTVPFLFLKDWDRGIRPRSLILFLESLEHVARLDVSQVLPGHGSFEIDHRLWIERIRKHHARIQGRLLHHLAKGPATVYELARRLYRSQLDNYTFLVFSEVVGNLDVMERDGRVGFVVEDDGTIRYRQLAAQAVAAPGDSASPSRAPQLVLDRDGRWLEGGEEITHERTVEALTRGLTKDESGDFVVVLGRERRKVVVEDAPFVVQRVEAGDGAANGPLTLLLGGGIREPLDPATLSIGAGHVMYARARGGLRARFSRAAYYQLAAFVSEDVAGHFVLVTPDGSRHAISEAAPREPRGGEL